MRAGPVMVCAWARRLRGWCSGLLCLPLLAACLGPPYETGRVQDLVPGAREQAVRVDGRSIHWVEVGDEAASPVLFIHGKPGNWQAYADYLNAPELAGFHRIAVDRPGFGESAEGGVEPEWSSPEGGTLRAPQEGGCLAGRLPEQLPITPAVRAALQRLPPLCGSGLI